MRGGLWSFLAASSLCAIALGCGPSLKTLVESDMRFEHCYRIDEDPHADFASKRACWADWTTHYSRGQDRSRVSYAKERLHVLDGVAKSGPPAPPVACPTPSSPYAPPPAVVEKKSEGDVSAATSSTCNDACTKNWRSCITPCGPGSGCASNCDTSYKSCMNACM